MFRNILIAAALIVAAPAFGQQVARTNAIQSLNAASSGYAEAAEGPRVHYEVYGEAEPVVVLAGASLSVAEVRRKWEGVVEGFVSRDRLERREPASLDDQNCFVSPDWTQSRCPRCKERSP